MWMLALALAATQARDDVEPIPSDMLALCSLENDRGCGEPAVVNLTASRPAPDAGSPLASLTNSSGCDPFGGCGTVAMACRLTRDVARVRIEEAVLRAVQLKGLGIRRSDETDTAQLFIASPARAHATPIYFLRADLSRIPVARENRACALRVKSIAMSRNAQGAPAGWPDEISDYLVMQVRQAMR